MTVDPLCHCPAALAQGRAKWLKGTNDRLIPRSSGTGKQGHCCELLLWATANCGLAKHQSHGEHQGGDQSHMYTTYIYIDKCII